MRVLNVAISCAVLAFGNGQNLPPIDVFLTWLLNVTSSEIDSLATNFNFNDVSAADIKFLLHAPPPTNQTLRVDRRNARQHLDPTKPTKLIIHGWQAKGTDDVHRKMAEKYHRKGDYNVIAVDWSEHSKKNYLYAASSTQTVGEVIGEFILDLVKTQKETLDNIHMIGHSLGAHVAGFAGKHISKRSPRKVGRITGLDVAAPFFEMPVMRDVDSRLYKNDAQFVDVIHTNGGFLGASEPLGTADFYVENGGPLQPGCLDPNIIEAFACSHYKAFEYFQESILDKKFNAVSCRNSIDYHLLICADNEKSLMGEDVPRNSSGNYFLETESALPYSRLFDNDSKIRLFPART